jgi:hypothetical protein
MLPRFDQTPRTLVVRLAEERAREGQRGGAAAAPGGADERVRVSDAVGAQRARELLDGARLIDDGVELHASNSVTSARTCCSTAAGAPAASTRRTRLGSARMISRYPRRTRR